VRARRLATVRSAWEVFGFSILYLFVLFLGLIVDAIWRIPIL
jgi:heme O synthase-like polyprenyltransferase